MRVALDTRLLDPVADPEELGEALDRLRAHRGGPGGDEQRDRDERDGAARSQRADRGRAEQHRREREPEPDHGGHRAREHDAERAGRDRDERPAAARGPTVAERDADRAEDERRARQRREVVDPDEGRLPLPRPLALELRDDPEELEEAPGGRRDAPGDRARGGAARGPRRPHDEDRGGEQRRVPRELGDADRVRS